MKGLPGWGISTMPGLSSRQHQRERQYTRVTHPIIRTRWMKGWLWRPNDIRGPCGPKASWHLSYRWGKTPKKPHPGSLSRLDIKPGPAAWQARMLPPAPQRWTVLNLISIYQHNMTKNTMELKLTFINILIRFDRLEGEKKKRGEVSSFRIWNLFEDMWDLRIQTFYP